MARTCAVRLMGGFEVEFEGRPVPAGSWRHRRGADLVKLLALAPDHRLHRDQVMQDLWPELGAEAAAANLRKAIHFARRALERAEAIETEGDMIALWPKGRLEIDLESFDRAAAGAFTAESGYEQAIDLYGGELLPADRYAEWTAAQRERLQHRYLQLLRKMGRWEDVLRIDRTDEIACRALMRAHLEAGDRSAAIRQFQRLREVLRVDLGVAPEAGTVALFEESIAGRTQAPASSSERVQALLARGLMQWNDRDLDAAQKSAQEARELALGEHLGRDLGEASALLGMVAMARGRWPEVFRSEFTTAVQLEADEEPFILDAHLCLAEASMAGVNAQSMGDLARDLLETAMASRSARGQGLLSLLIGESELFGGHLDAAGKWLGRASGIYLKLGGGSAMAIILMRLAELASIHSRHAEMERQLRTARGLAEESPLTSHLRPRVMEVMIKTSRAPEESLAVVDDAESLAARPREMCRPCSIGLAVAATIACARAANLARSRYWLGHAERFAGMWSGGPWQAAVWEARAALRAAEGDRTQADALLLEAGNLYGQFGRPLDEARCRSGIAVG